MTNAASPSAPSTPRSRTVLVVAVLSLLGSLAACGGGDDGDQIASVQVDPVVFDDRGLPDGRDAGTVPWDEVDPGWTLLVYDPGPADEARPARLLLVEPDGDRYDLADIDLGPDDVLVVEDWLPDGRQALLARTNPTSPDSSPGALELVDLGSGARRELQPLGHDHIDIDIDIDIATLSRPTGKVILFADGVDGPLQRRSPDWDVLSTVAEAATSWVHSPDGALIAVGTHPSAGAARLTVNANDTGEVLAELAVPDGHAFCDPQYWWDADTLLAACGDTDDTGPALLWRFPVDGSAAEALELDSSSATGAVLRPDGTWVVTTDDGRTWDGASGDELAAELSTGVVLVGGSAVGIVVIDDGDLRVVDPADGATATLLARRPEAPGVVSAVTLTAGGFTATRPSTTAGGTGGSATDPTDSVPEPAAPEPGQALVIVAVRHDDVLNFRAEPDPSAEIVDTARPDIAQYPRTTGILATGLARSVGSSTWWQVTVDGREAWANARYLGVLGPVDDATADLVDLEASGEVALEDVVAAARPYAGAWGTMVYLEGVDAISSYATIDVLGPVGAGIKGERFTVEAGHLIGEDDEGAPHVVGLRIWTAERTMICEVGLDASGGCR